MEEDKDSSVLGNTSFVNTQCLLGNIDKCLDDLDVPQNKELSSHQDVPIDIIAENHTLCVDTLNKSEPGPNKPDLTDTVLKQTDSIKSDVSVHLDSEMKTMSNVITSSGTSIEPLITNKTVSKESVSLQLNLGRETILNQQETNSEQFVEPKSGSSQSVNSSNSSFITNSGKVISKSANLSSQSLELFTPESDNQCTPDQNTVGDNRTNDSKRRRSSESYDDEHSKKSKVLKDSEEGENESSNIPVEVNQDTIHSTDIDTDENTHSSYELSYKFDKEPGQITGAWEEYTMKENNFVKGCKWSPDGSCLLTNSDDNKLRLFNTPTQIYEGSMENVPEMKSVLSMKGGETIYDYCWYPLMNSSDPDSCCLISTSRCMPVHMWDAFSGDLICSYRSYDQADEMVPAHSVAFNNEGSKIYCGFNKTIRVFDVSRPGREFENRKTFVKSVGQPGIISCIKFSPVDNSLYAAGSYSRTVALYYEPAGELAWSFTGHQGGITHIVWSPDGTKLYSGARKDNEIICWDLRNPSKILFTVDRKVETNQRIYFDIDSSGRYLVSGNHDGTVSVWDVLDLHDSRPKPILSYKAHHDTVNGVSLNPCFPVLATSSGQRHYPILGDSDDSDLDDLSQTTDCIDNSVGLWWLGS